MVSLVAGASFLPGLFQKGMFVDGVVYATIARNMALGLGSFWKPFYTETVSRTFHQQPPLALWMHSIPFRVFGDHFLIDRLYSLSMGLLSAVLMMAIWRRLFPGLERAMRAVWLPLLLWLMMRKVTWSYRSNVLENTMGFFCLASVYGSLVALTGRRFVVGISLSMLSTCAALLSKGVPGLFPLVSPLLAYSTLPRIDRRRAMATTAILALGAAGFLVLLSFSEPASHFLVTYTETHVLPGLGGRVDQLDSGTLSRAAFLLRLARILVVPGTAILILWGVSRYRRWTPYVTGGHPGPALFSLLVGLCASLPLVVSGKLRTHYLVPSLAFYALGLGAVVLPFLPGTGVGHDPERSMTARRVVRALVVITLVSLLGHSLSRWGGISRDQAILGDVLRIGDVVPRGETIGLDPGLQDQHELHAYMYRYHQISLDGGSREHAYFLGRTNPEVEAPKGFHRVSLTTERFTLLQRE